MPFYMPLYIVPLTVQKNKILFYFIKNIVNFHGLR